MKIETGEVVNILLQNPREKIWGVLREINSTGVFVRGLDLNQFEDFVRAVANCETVYGLCEQFVPLWRVEKISKDETDGDIPSLQQQFFERTGKHFGEFCSFK